LSDIIATRNKVSAVVCRSPFLAQHADYEFPEGLTIRQMLDIVNLPPQRAFVVSVRGQPVRPSEYATLVPRQGDFIAIRAVPTGGGGDKDPLRTILTIVVIAAAIVMQVYFPGTIIFGKYIGLYTLVGGMLAVNAICPPASTDEAAYTGSQTYSDSPTYSISAPSNTLNPYGPVPSLLGEYRIYPPYAARPYTEILGDDQYLRMLFLVGNGSITITDMKLGETLLTNYSDYELEIIEGTPDVVQNSTLYPQDVYQTDLTITLKQAEGWHAETTQPNTVGISTDITFLHGLIEFDSAGNRVQRTVQVEFQYSVAGEEDWKGSLQGMSMGVQNFPLDQRYLWRQCYSYHLVVVNKTNGVASVIYGQGSSSPDRTDLFPACPSWACPLAGVVVIGESVYNPYSDLFQDVFTIYSMADKRPAEFVSEGYFAVTYTPGTCNISVGAGTVITDVYTVTGCTTSMVRRTFFFPVEQGQYDVRLRRVTADTASTQIFDEVTWTALRSFQAGEPVKEPNVTLIALRIKASETFSSVIDNLNCIGQIVCQDYDIEHDIWTERPTSNPASLYRYALQGPGNKRPLSDAQIGLDVLKEWHERCRLNGFTFDHYVDYRSSVDDMLAMIAAAGRASRGYVDGKYAVVMDKPQVNYAQHYTPRNSWGYKYSKTFLELPHGFRVKFRNSEAGYKEDERIVYDDGYDENNATLFEELSLPGVVTADLAWKHGRYHIATARLRPENHTFYSDFEHFPCTRGDLIRFASDVICVGLGYGRIKGYTDDYPQEDPPTRVLSITVDEELSMEAGKSYSLRYRKHDGTSIVASLETVPGTGKTFNVTSLIPIAEAPDRGALFLYGESEEEGIDLIVTRIVPGKDLTAQITGIAAAPEVHDADQGTIPEFNTHITTPVDRWQIYVPIIDQVRADETVMDQSSTGMPIARILVTLMPQELPEGAVDRLQARYTIQSTSNPYLYAETTSLGEIALESGIIEGETYILQVRYRIDGRWGKWSTETAVTVSRQVTNPPATPTGLTIDFTGKDCLFAWDVSIDIAFDHYLLTLNGHQKIINQRQQSSYSYTFDENTGDNAGPVNSLPYNLKVVDVFGTESAALTGTATNGAPATPTGIQLASAFKAFTVVFPPNTETDIKGYEIHVSTQEGFTPGPGTLYASGPQTSARYEGEANTTYYVRVRAYDWFGSFSEYCTEQSIGTAIVLADELYSALKVDFLVRDSIFSFTGDTLSWTAGYITRGDTEYTLSAGSLPQANQKYINATLSAGAATLSAADVGAGLPEVTGDQVVIAFTGNVLTPEGNYICYVRQANSMMIEGANIRNATITEAQIANLAVTNAKIADLSVEKLTSGTMTSKSITLQVQDGSGDAAIKIGKTDFGQDSTPGIIIGVDDSDNHKAKFELSLSPSEFIKMDGSGINVGRDTRISGCDAYNNITLFYHETFGSIDAFAVSTNGTASITFSTGTARLSVTDSGAYANLYRQLYSSCVYPRWTYSRRFKFRPFLSGLTNVEAYVVTGYVTFDDGGHFGFSHFGFRFLNGEIYGTTGNGAAPEGTQTLLDLNELWAPASGGAQMLLEAVFTPGSDVKFYINNVLRGTITTTLPGGWMWAGHGICAIIKSTGSGTKYIELGDFMMLQE
jgi:sulfur carrier protein ThiS